MSVPLASGRTADVFAVDAQRVLRRYRNGHDVTAEAVVMAYVGERGFPVPKVHAAHDADLVMERLDGPTMLQALLAGEIDVRTCAGVLTEMHRRLHELPARLSADSGQRIVHLDLHPGNVILSSRGPVVIDWCNATEDAPALDLAVSALIIAEVAVDDTNEMSAPARAVLASFVADIGGEPLRALERAVAMRRADPNLRPEEIGRLARAAALVTSNG